MNFTREERLLLEQVFRHLELNAGVSYYPHRRFLIRLMNSSVHEASDPTTVDPGKPADIEVIAERLAKVEEGLASLHKLVDSLTGLAERLAGNYSGMTELHAKVHERITKVADVIGERVSGLVDRIEQIENVDLKAGYDSLGHGRRKANPPAFPTGGARTAEAAAEAVLPVPQRGDRVRLEGAGRKELTGWFDVTGSNSVEDAFQIAIGDGGLTWLRFDEPGLKEVRHAQS